MSLFGDKYKSLVYYFIFVISFEALHILIGGAPSLILRCVYGCVYLLFCLTNPKFIPYFIAINLVIERSSIVFGEYLPSTILFHCVFLLYYSLYFRNKKRLIFYNKSEVSLYVILGFYLLFNAIFHLNFFDIYFIIFSLLMLRALSYYNIDELKHYMLFIIISVLISCIFVFFNLDSVSSQYTVSGLDIETVNRTSWKDGNYISCFLSVSFLLCLFFLKNCQYSQIRKMCIFTMIVLMLSMLLLISRGAIVALSVTLFFYLFKDIFSKKFFAYLLSFLLILFITFKLGFLDGLILRFMSDDLMSGSGRTDLWNVGLKNFFHQDILHIIFGVGPHNAMSLINLYGYSWSPHNNFLEILFDYGVVGLIFFVGLFGYMFFNTNSKEKQTLLVFIMINSMTIVPFIYVSQIWLIVPLMFFMNRYYNRIFD